MMRTVDTDGVVIAISFAKKINISEFWIAFGAGKHYIYLAIHEIAFSLGPSKYCGLLFFYAFTGCYQLFQLLLAKERRLHGTLGRHIVKFPPPYLKC